MTDGSRIPIFDADNHMYETPDAMTKHLPSRYKGLVDYVDVHGRTKIAVKGKISEYIPNPTFDVVARPGAQEDYYRKGNPEGKSARQIFGEPMRAIPAFREPAPRLELLDEQGVDRTLMFPTLASLIEERLRDDPDAMHVVIHALNEWMYETWQFNYEGLDRIFSTPVITLPIVDKAIEELEWVVEHDILVALHSSDSGYDRYTNEWNGGSGEMLPFQTAAFRMLHSWRPVEDAVASLVCHGALSRFPTLKVAVIENGSSWVEPLLRSMKDLYKKRPQDFQTDPVQQLKERIHISPFWEEDLNELADLIGEDRVLFGSDYPHPEGLAEPRSYVAALDGAPEGRVGKIMGGNLARLMNVDATVPA